MSSLDTKLKLFDLSHSSSFNSFWAALVAERVRSLNLTAVAGVGSNPALATCETSHVLLAGVSGDFPGVLPFCPTYRLACLDMSEIILKLNKKKIKKITASVLYIHEYQGNRTAPLLLTTC